MILAGGQGTRLRPLTLARAKPVVPLLNRPFLAYQLALLRAHGVSDVILACSYRVDDVRAALGDGAALGVRLRYVLEREPLGTGGGVRNAADLVSGTLYVLNGDILTDADLTAMQALHESRGSRTTIYLQPVPDPRQYGLVETAPDGRLRAFREKPTADEEITTNTINAGIYLIDAPLLQLIPLDRASSIEREFFPALIAEGSAWVLLLLVLAKGLAYALSLGAAFRGGPVFPAIAIGVAAAVMAADVLPGFDTTPAVAVGIAAGTAAVMRVPFTAVLLATLLMGSSSFDVAPIAVFAAATGWLVATALPTPEDRRAISGEAADAPVGDDDAADHDCDQ